MLHNRRAWISLMATAWLLLPSFVGAQLNNGKQEQDEEVFPC
jgi:hypothetical protein